jgi:Sec-independent protein translocase protein TatA
MRSLGQSVTQFKKGMTETDEETPDPKLPPKNDDAT